MEALAALQTFMIADLHGMRPLAHSWYLTAGQEIPEPDIQRCYDNGFYVKWLGSNQAGWPAAERREWGGVLTGSFQAQNCDSSRCNTALSNARRGATEKVYISIGGIEQWIETGGDNPANPALLYLHGGPGGSSSLAADVFKPWERHFTVVHWDQRGAGRTFARNGEAGCGALTIERMVADAIEVAEFVTCHLNRDKIVLVGHSWGSVLGVHLVKRRPELFSAFVGTGQVVNMRRNEEFNYARQLGQSLTSGNATALAALEEIGPPPYFDRARIRVLREWADILASGSGDAPRFGPKSRPANLSPEDVQALTAGFTFSGNQLFDELCEVDLPALGLEFPIPMFCFMGSDDQQTPIEPAEAWFTSITAPRKAFVRFEGCHHFVVMNRPEMFLEQMLNQVVPAILPPETP